MRRSDMTLPTPGYDLARMASSSSMHSDMTNNDGLRVIPRAPETTTRHTHNDARHLEESISFERKLSAQHLNLTPPSSSNGSSSGNSNSSSMSTNNAASKTKKRDRNGKTNSGGISTRMRAVTQYLKTVSNDLGHTKTAVKTSLRSKVATMRKSPVTLGQYIRRSVPDLSVLQQGNRRWRPSVPFCRNSAYSPPCTPLSWEEELQSARDEFVLSSPEISSPPSATGRALRRRSSSDIFDEDELRQMCIDCGVPAANVEPVMTIITDSFGTMDFDVTELDKLVEGNSLLVVGMLVFHSVDGDEELLTFHKLPALFRHIQSRYHAHNPFHNACHAADVLHTLFVLLWTTDMGRKIAIHNQIAVLLAAAMHDIEHVGLTNEFILKTNHPLSTQYPAPAPLEDMHQDIAIQLMQDPRFDVYGGISKPAKDEMLWIVREAIRATALCYQKDMLGDVAHISAVSWGKHLMDSSVLPLELQTLVLRIALHVSDIGQTMKPFAIHTKWVSRLNDEQMRQGELDRNMHYGVCSPNCFRDQWNERRFLDSQVLFLENVAQPAIRTLNSIPWLNVDGFVNELQRNMSKWDTQLELETMRSPE